MLSYVWRDLVRNPRRTLASLVGVVLGVGLFSGVLFFIDGSGATMTKRALEPLALDMQRVLTNPLGGGLRLEERVSPPGALQPGQKVTITLTVRNRGRRARQRGGGQRRAAATAHLRPRHDDAERQGASRQGRAEPARPGTRALPASTSERSLPGQTVELTYLARAGRAVAASERSHCRARSPAARTWCPPRRTPPRS